MHIPVSLRLLNQTLQAWNRVLQFVQFGDPLLLLLPVSYTVRAQHACYQGSHVRKVTLAWGRAGKPEGTLARSLSDSPFSRGNSGS